MAAKGATHHNSHDPYPKQLKLRDGTEVTIRRMESKDQEKIIKFALKLPEDDLLFLRTDITDPAVVREWAEHVKHGDTVTLLAEIDGQLVGYASLHVERARWTKRIGEIRVNAATTTRGKGLGRLLTTEAFELGSTMGLKKLAAMMTPDQRAARSAFERLGFRVEAILADWVDDRSGHSRDLLVLTHDLEGFHDHVVARH